MEKSEEVYRIRLGKKDLDNYGLKVNEGNFEGGAMYFNQETKEIDVFVSSNGNDTPMAILAQELKHVDQFENYKLDVGTHPNYYDQVDEIEGHKRQALFTKILNFNPEQLVKKNYPQLRPTSSSKVISDIEMKLDEDNYYSIGKKDKELPTISIVKGNLPAYKKGVNDREREKE